MSEISEIGTSQVFVNLMSLDWVPEFCLNDRKRAEFGLKTVLVPYLGSNDQKLAKFSLRTVRFRVMGAGLVQL